MTENPLDNLSEELTGPGWPLPRRNDPLRLAKLSERLEQARRSDPVLQAVRTDGRPGPAFQPPSYPGDCGLDLALSQDVEIDPGCSVNAPTGVAVALPPDTFGWITGRSSTWSRQGLMVMPGIIDQGWRGELMVMLYRPVLSQYDILLNRDWTVKLKAGTRLAQLIILPNLLSGLAVVDLTGTGIQLPGSARGEKGFGSSGD